jgi:hypothetical protein
MITFKEIKSEWRELEQEDKDFFKHILIFFLPIVSVIVWLCSTNTPPVFDVKTENTQLEKQNYELKGDWAKYAQGVYTRKYGK